MRYLRIALCSKKRLKKLCCKKNDTREMALRGDNGSAEIRDRGAKLLSSYKCWDIMDI